MKAYSGKFVLRMPAEQHQNLVLKAQKQNCSLNHLCLDLIAAGQNRRQSKPAWQTGLEKQLLKIKKQFGENLVGVAIFGSRVNQTATSSSDVDVLVCVTKNVVLNRSLYSWWDETIINTQFDFNPVFAHLPDLQDASSLWYEIALNNFILFDPQLLLQQALARLIAKVHNGDVTRKWSQGQAYWVLENA